MGTTKREVRIVIDESLYNALAEEASKRGYESIQQLILSIISEYLSTGAEGEITLDKIRSRVERLVQDEINRRLSDLDSIRSQVADIIERLEHLEERISKIESKSGEIERPAKGYAGRKSAMERLKEEKVRFEKDFGPRVDREKLISYFERAGAIVIRTSKERIVVDPDFWEKFKTAIYSIDSIKEEDIMAKLGEPGFSLWKALYEDGLVYYDSKSKKWRFTEEIK